MKIVDHNEPFERFGKWYAAAARKEPNDPNAMALATVDAEGRPAARMVLLKSWDECGFVFYTNCESRKGHELEANPHTALLFHWKSMRRQVRIEGPATLVTEAEADAYFATRPKDAQIGAWASDQSRPMDARLILERRIVKYAAKFGLGKVPRPPHWSGYRVEPRYFEFWINKKYRLHDRAAFTLQDDGNWAREILYP